MRSYELMFILDPRISEEEGSGLTNDFRKLVEAAGAEVIRVENWGRRKLAYEIDKQKEGRYVLFYILSETGEGLAGIERRMKQHDKVLRYMTIRTDEELQRAGLPLPSPEEEQTSETAEAASEPSDSREKE